MPAPPHVDDDEIDDDLVPFSLAEPARVALGLSVTGDGRRMAAAAVRVHRHGLSMLPTVVAARAAEMPAEAARIYATIVDGRGGERSFSLNEFAALGEQLADAATELALAALESLGDCRREVVAAGWSEPGIWFEQIEGHRAQLTALNAARLAEATGLTWIDQFPARDLAAGGRGAPLDTLPNWLLFADRRLAGGGRARGVAWLDPPERILYLPPGDLQTLPRAPIEVELSNENRSPLSAEPRELAQAIAQAIQTQLPQDPSAAEVVLIGRRRFDAALRRELAYKLRMPLLPLEEFGCDDDTLAAAQTALLALCHLDRLPANGATGSEKPRVLGRLTPGNERHWQRLVRQLAERSQATLPLRRAV